MCWVISDGRRGIENQALGLAEAIGLPFEIKRVRPSWLWRIAPAEAYPLLNTLCFSQPLFASRADMFRPPWPRLLIATGRLSLPYSIAVKRLSRGRTFTVQTQDPRVSPKHFSLVVPPYHDGLHADNVVAIVGAPNRVRLHALRDESISMSRRLAHLPRPLVAVLIGGSSKAHKMSKKWMKRFAESLGELARLNKVGLAITPSRRTGEENISILRQTLSADGAYIWDGEGNNPYFGMLGLADYIVVTSDSTNMATDAAATGKPLYVAHVPGGSRKFRAFHEDLTARGIARPFTGELQYWSYPPLNETQRVANLIRERLNL